MNKKLLILATSLLSLTACDGIVIETDAETGSTVKTIGFKDNALTACYNQQIAQNGWVNLEDVQELSCSSDFAITRLEGIEKLPELKSLTLDGYNLLREADIAVLASTSGLKMLDLSESLVLNCASESVLFDALDPSVEVYTSACVEIPFALPNVTDTGLSQCLSDLVTANEYTLLNEVSVLNCGADYVISTLAGLEQFSALSELTLSGYANVSESDRNLLGAMQNLTSVDLTGALVLPCSDEPKLREALAPVVPVLPECQLSEVALALDNVTDAALKNCLSIEHGSKLNLSEVTALTCAGSYKLTVKPDAKDKELEASAREALVVEGGVADLEGLGQFTSLEALNLSFNTLSEIDELSSLTALKKLDLSWTYVNDAGVAVLDGLTQLEELSLKFVKGITDSAQLQAALNKMTLIKSLNLDAVGAACIYNKWAKNCEEGIISDVSFVGTMPALEHFVVARNNQMAAGLPSFAGRNLDVLKSLDFDKARLNQSRGAANSVSVFADVLSAGSNISIDLNNNPDIDCAEAIAMASHVTGLDYSQPKSSDGTTGFNAGNVLLPGSCKP